MNKDLTHLNRDGSVRMVDVGDKPDTERRAVFQSRIRMGREAFDKLERSALPKGDALNTARIAGIQAAKQTAHLIPLCHPVFLTSVEIRFELERETHSVRIEAEARTVSATGVEMEALVAAQTAAMTLYDMGKAVEREMVIEDCRLLHKSGGKSDTSKEEP
ncbi:MAG: cyclic pyranopterin monophosphate synthase MoaC [Desulfohalobiaceae bacterium]|nr:cyclic pyranopterin monophosphate synthase MoaC [Desulfohalobiaceae bacterium]